MATPEHPRQHDEHPALWHMIRIFLHDLAVDAERLRRAVQALREDDPAGRIVIVERLPIGDYVDYDKRTVLGNDRDKDFIQPHNWLEVGDIEDELPYRRTIFTGVPEELSFAIRDWVGDNVADAHIYLAEKAIPLLPVTDEDLVFVGDSEDIEDAPEDSA